MENKKTAGICKTFLFIFTIIFFSYLVNSGSCDGDFIKYESDKYYNTWIATITCEDYDGNHVTIGNGNSWEIPRLVSERIDELNLPYRKPVHSIRRSTGASGGGFEWTDYGTVDTNTVTAVCKILGYEEYVSSTCRDNEESWRYPNGKCNHHSPEDADTVYFSGEVCIYECSDNIDNDGDGLIDEEDPGCWTDTSDPNTYDPKLDDESKADPECIADSDCAQDSYGPNYCFNGDVYREKTTFSCSNTYKCTSNTIDEKIKDCSYGCEDGSCIGTSTECNDGIDNDGDGKIDALITKDFGSGDFYKRGASPKYSQTWIATITCKDFDGENEKIGNGNPFVLSTLVSEKIDALDLPYRKPDEPIRMSTSADGGGFRWTDYGNIDTDSVEAVCSILGYKEYVTSTCLDHERSSRYPNGKCNFHSPENNEMFYFSGDSYLPACSDGVDNDGDGKIDMEDDGCESPNDDSEIKHDPGCDSPMDDSEAFECEDGIDNDNDGLTDSEDPGCWTNRDDPSSYDPEIDNEARADPGCITDSDCPSDSYGSNFCFSGNVYREKTTYDCSDIYKCTSNTIDEKVKDCSYGCEDGSCIEAPTECEDGIDNDNDDLIDSEDPGCWNDPTDPSTYDPELDDESAYDIACFEDNDCGTTTLFDTICKNSDVFNLFLEPQCKNPGTGLASCETTINEEFKQSCDYGCANGQCFGECDTEADCGGDTYSEKFCNDNNDVYKIFYDVSCEDHVCSESSSWIFVEGCDYGCSNGECIGECSVDSDCGEDYTSDKYCGDDDNVYQDEYKVYCSDDNVCKEELYETVLIEECSHGCTDGTCDDFADDQGPIIEIISPEDGEVVNGVVNFSYTAEDEKSDIANCSLIVGGETLESSDSVTPNINNFTSSFEEEKTYSFFISCFDTQDNYAESETREFTYEILECTCDLDCGDPSERHYCEADNLMEEVTTPVCTNNTCEFNKSVRLIRTCIDGCMNGVCLSDPQDEDNVNGGGSDDDDCEDCEEDTQVSFSDSFKKNETAISFGKTRYSFPNNSNKKTIALQEKKIDVLNEKEEERPSWWAFWIILLILAIIIVLIIIMFIVAR